MLSSTGEGMVKLKLDNLTVHFLQAWRGGNPPVMRAFMDEPILLSVFFCKVFCLLCRCISSYRSNHFKKFHINQIITLDGEVDRVMSPQRYIHNII